MSGPTDGPHRWRVGLIDAHPLFGMALERLFATTDDLDLGRDLANGRGVPRADAAPRGGDLGSGLDRHSTPYDNAIALQERRVRVVVYTSGEHPELLRSAARAGVLGVILKSESPEITVAAIRAAVHGLPAVTTQWAAAVDGDVSGAVDLSPQLQRVLTHYASGETAPAIARNLGITTDTVNDHLERIRVKYTQAGRPTRSKLDVFKRAVEDGFPPIPRRRRPR